MGLWAYCPSKIPVIFSMALSTLFNAMISVKKKQSYQHNQLFDKCTGGLRVLYTEKENSKDIYQPFNVNTNKFLSPNEIDMIEYSIRYEYDRKMILDFSMYKNILIQINKKSKKYKTIVHRREDKNRSIVKLDFSTEEISLLVSCLSQERSEDYDTWKQVGWCLFNLYYFNGYSQKDMYELWDCFSQLSDKYDSTEVKNEWDKSVKDGYKLGSLCMWAQFDSPKKYKTIVRKKWLKCPIQIDNIFDDLLLKNTLDSKSPMYLFDNGNNKSVDVITEETDYISNAKIFSDRDELFNAYETIIIKSPTGTGKTTFTSKILNNNSTSTTTSSESSGSDDTVPVNAGLSRKRVLSIVSRQTMAYQHVASFDFTNYLDKTNNDRFKSTYLVCSLEQLHCINDVTKYDYLFLDEFASLLAHIRSSTMKNVRRQNWQVFCDLIKNVKCVIACDATLNDACIALLTTLRDKSTTLFYHNKIKNKKKVKVNIFTNDICDWKPNVIQPSDYKVLKRVYADIKNNRKFVVASDSKALLEEIYQSCILYGMKFNHTINDFALYTSQFGNNADIANINTICKNKFIFWTPKVIYGIDVTIPYQNAYAFYHGKTINAFGMLQQIGRTRNVKNIWISIHNTCNLNNKYKNNTYLGIKQEIKDRIANYTKYIARANQEYRVEKDVNILTECMSVTYETNGRVLSDDALYSKVFFHNETFNNYIDVYKLEALIKFLDDQGYKIKLTHICENEENAMEDRDILNAYRIGLRNSFDIAYDYHTFRDETNDQINHVIFNEKRKIAQDVYVNINDTQHDIIQRGLDLCKYLKIDDLNLLKESVTSDYIKLIFKDTKGLEKLFKSLLILFKVEHIAKLQNDTSESELNLIPHYTFRKTIFLFELEKNMGIKRFDVHNIIVTDKLNTYMEFNKNKIINVFEMRARKKRINKLYDANDYKSLMISIYKHVCPGVFYSDDSTRVWNNEKQKQVRVQILDAKYIGFLLEIKVRLNMNDKEYFIKELYDEYSKLGCVLNNLYSTHYKVINDI